ncbi:MAG: hypothetical protein H6R38_484 [Deltaproteobacteria bacterium]|jgi:hypothetical protein|nr:hypothetical protein [Deltaproteobacteria bacterium]
MNPTVEIRGILRGGLTADMEAEGGGLVGEGARPCPACGSAMRLFRLKPYLLHHRLRNEFGWISAATAAPYREAIAFSAA